MQFESGSGPDTKYMAGFLEKLLKSPSPTGYTHKIMETVGEEAERLDLELCRTPKGGGVLTLPGRDRSRTVGLSAHVDTLGAMVRSVTDKGMLKIVPIGGYMMHTVEGEYCHIHTRSGRVYSGTVLTTMPSVHVYDEAKEQKREEKNMEIRLDEKAGSREDVRKLGIRTGDIVSFDPRVQILDNGFVKSRHLDDKAGVAAIFGLLEYMKRNNLQTKHDLQILISCYEEVGHGASSIPAEIEELIAVDMGAIGEDLGCTEFDVSICAKDSSGPYDYAMVSRLIELAESRGIRHAVDIYPHYGSDASAALRGGNNIRAALIGPGVHASHGMERTHLTALAETARLLEAYLI